MLRAAASKTARAYWIAFDLAEELRPIYTRFGHALPNRNGEEIWAFPLPATLVIDSAGTVRLAYVNTDYRTRLEPSAIIGAHPALD